MSLSKILRFSVGILAVVAFVMLFTDQVRYTLTVLGMQKVTLFPYTDILLDVVEEGNTLTKGASLSLIGYIVVLVSGLVVFATTFFNNKFINFINIICAVALLAGGTLVLLTIEVWKNANPGDFSAVTALIKTGTLQLASGPVVAGILSIVASLATIFASVIAPAKTKKKRK